MLGRSCIRATQTGLTLGHTRETHTKRLKTGSCRNNAGRNGLTRMHKNQTERMRRISKLIIRVIRVLAFRCDSLNSVKKQPAAPETSKLSRILEIFVF